MFRKKIHQQESRMKIVLEGGSEYKRELQEVRQETKNLREEIEQLNIVLGKEVELLKKLR